MTDPYLHNREFFGSVSGNYRVLAADTGLIVLVPAIPAHTLFIQKIHVEVTTLAGSELWTFQDGAGVPLVPAVSAAAVAHFDYDFGPDGVPCTEATGFQLNITGATGAAGPITWEGFKKLTLGTAASAGGGAPAASDIGTPPLIVSKPGIGTVTTDGVVLQNPTVATAAVPEQWSPRLRLSGSAWKSNAVAGSQASDWIIENEASQGAAAIASALSMFHRRDGTTTGSIQVSQNGTVTTTGSYIVGASGLIFWNGRAVLESPADARLMLENNAQSAGIGFDVALDATLKLRNRAFTGDAQLSAASVRGNAVTFANLPAAPVEGMVCWVTDSTVNTWGTVIAGGGANHVLACFNGTAWTVAGK